MFTQPFNSDADIDIQKKPLFGSITQPGMSIVVPTKNESGNVELLLNRIQNAMEGTPIEVIFVDDSTDETPQVISSMVEKFPGLEIKLIHRPSERRTGGLGGAVVEGMRAAQAPYACVMDGDLQHPPELLPVLYEKAEIGQNDLVVASRRVAESDSSGLGFTRTIISRSLDLIARVMFPRELRGVSDPLTGFFLVRLCAIDVERLRPNGFKILLDILVRNPLLKKAEIPFHFAERHTGKSKASSKEAWRYLNLLLKLRFSERTVHFFEFALVGVSGILVNTLVMAIATSLLGLHYLVSAAVATVGSTTWNFLLTEFWVFGNSSKTDARWKRFVMFFIMNNIALLFRSPIIYGLTSILGIHYLISNFVSLAVLTVLRYLLADTWIWGSRKSKSDALQTYP